MSETNIYPPDNYCAVKCDLCGVTYPADVDHWCGDRCVCGHEEASHAQGVGYCSICKMLCVPEKQCAAFRDAETVKAQIKTAETKMIKDLDRMANDVIEEQKDKWQREGNYLKVDNLGKPIFGSFVGATEIPQKVYGYTNGEVLPKKVLDLRFVILPSGVVMEVLQRDERFEFANIRASNGFVIMRSDTDTEFNGRSVAIGTYQPAVVCTNAVTFDTIKQALTEFANSNAFFGDGKPVPRIELTDTGYYLHIKGVGAVHLTDETLSALNELGCEAKPLQIYTPKRFKSEFVQEFPRKLDVVDDNIKTPYDDICTLNDATNEVKGICVDYFNQLQNSDVEIWRFSMWEE